MPQPDIITVGDDLALVQDLYENGVLVDVSAATIKASFQDGYGRILIASTVQSSGASGASWSTGRVVCEFSATLANQLVRGDAFLEVEVTRAGKKTTWPLIPFEVQQGSIL